MTTSTANAIMQMATDDEPLRSLRNVGTCTEPPSMDKHAPSYEGPNPITTTSLMVSHVPTMSSTASAMSKMMPTQPPSATSTMTNTTTLQLVFQCKSTLPDAHKQWHLVPNLPTALYPAPQPLLTHSLPPSAATTSQPTTAMKTITTTHEMMTWAMSSTQTATATSGMTHQAAHDVHKWSKAQRMESCSDKQVCSLKCIVHLIE